MYLYIGIILFSLIDEPWITTVEVKILSLVLHILQYPTTIGRVQIILTSFTICS